MSTGNIMNKLTQLLSRGGEIVLRGDVENNRILIDVHDVRRNLANQKCVGIRDALANRVELQDNFLLTTLEWAIDEINNYTTPFVAPEKPCQP